MKLFVGYKLWMNIEHWTFLVRRFSFISIMYYIKFNDHSKLTENEITECSSNKHNHHTYYVLLNIAKFPTVHRTEWNEICSHRTVFLFVWLLQPRMKETTHGSTNYDRFAMWNFLPKSNSLFASFLHSKKRQLVFFILI